MKQIYLVSLIIFQTSLVLVSDSFAFVICPDKAGVSGCDLIVEGTLISLVDGTVDGMDVAAGMIDVTGVIWPREEVADQLTVLWQNGPLVGTGSPGYSHKVNKPGIWSLRYAGVDTVTVSICSWYDISRREEAIAALSMQPIDVQIHPWPYKNYQLEKEIFPELHIVYRNAGQTAMAFPSIVMEENYLKIDNKICIEVAKYKRQFEAIVVVPPLVPIRYSYGIPRTTVEPEKEYRLVINLNQYFELEGGTYFIRVMIGSDYSSGWKTFRTRDDVDHEGQNRRAKQKASSN